MKTYLLEFFNEIVPQAREVAEMLSGYLSVPWAADYVLLFIAALSLIILLLVGKKIFLLVYSAILKPFQPMRIYLSEKARNRSEEKYIRKKIKKALKEKDYKAAGLLCQSINQDEEAAQMYLEANEYSSCGEIYEKKGDLDKAALFFKNAGNNTRAAELYLKIKDDKNAALMYEKSGYFRRAAELYENAGENLKAAEVYEICFIEERNPGTVKSRFAQMSGKLYEKAGLLDKAVKIYERASLFYEAALAHELNGDFPKAGDCYLHSDNLEKAAEAFEKGGDLRKKEVILSKVYYKKGQLQEAAAFAEKAGDPALAAEISMEAGSYAKAGESYARAGFFKEAGEMFLEENDFLRAAENFERAGRYIAAADAYQKTGQTDRKVADLYDKGGDHLRAGRLFMQLDLIDSALVVFQKIEPGSPDYKAASVPIGRIFWQKGMTDLAVEKFNKAIANEPVNKLNLEPYYYLALYHELSGRADPAKTIFNRILAEDYHYMDVSQRISQYSQ